MFCFKCGTQLPDGSAFCQKCGAAQNQQPAPAPQAPQAPQAPKAPAAAQGFDFNKFLQSNQYHDILMKFGFFIAAGVLALFGILLFTGCQYGGVSAYGINISYSSALYESNKFIMILDYLLALVCLAGAAAMVFFWAQLSGNNLGFLPMLDKALTFKIFNIVHLALPGASAFYFLVNGICVTSTSMGTLSFFAPWIGFVVLLLTGALLVFNKMYYTKHLDLFK